MTILIDANIIIDVLADRAELADESSLVWKLCESQTITGHITSLTFTNIIYILRKSLTPETVD